MFWLLNEHVETKHIEMLPSLEMPAFNTNVFLKVASTILEQSFRIKTMSTTVTSVKHISVHYCVTMVQYIKYGWNLPFSSSGSVRKYNLKFDITKCLCGLENMVTVTKVLSTLSPSPLHFSKILKIMM